MLFDQLPASVNAFLLMISCAIKHTAVSRMVHARWFQGWMRGRRWHVCIVLMSLAGGLGTYLIFDKFVGWPWAGYLAVIDAAAFAFTGYLVKRIKLFDMEHPKLFWTVLGLRTIHVVTYVVYIWLVLALEQAA